MIEIASLRETNQEQRTISHFVLHRPKFIIDRTFQREKGIWTREMVQYLIDSILKGYDIPKIYVQVRKDGTYAIVDGQQRLNSIWDFENDDFPLRKKFSGDLGGKKYDDLSMEDKIRFDNYNITVVFLRNYSEEEVRDLYRRLQSGKPLNTAEKLNAYLGNIVLTMRELASHPFFTNIVAVRSSRYRYYHLSAQLMLLESEGITDIAPWYLYDFFERKSDLNANSPVVKKIKRVLNYLRDAYESKTMELHKPSWIISLYLLVSHLLDTYVMNGREPQLKNFFTKFYQDIRNSATSGDTELIEFNLAISRGTTGKSAVQLRHGIFLRKFLINCGNLEPKDPKRGFTYEERIAVFRRDNGKCKDCDKLLDMNNFEVHHIKRWIDGGKTILENAKLLCPECHVKEHGKGITD